MKAQSHIIVLGAVIVLPGLAITSETRAGESASLRSCAASFKALCGKVKPGGGRIQACFDSHIAQLSEPCKRM